MKKIRTSPRKTSEIAALVYECISVVADAGGVCPSDREIANTIGSYDKAVSKALCYLENAGMITVNRSSGGCLRKVLIAATGRETSCVAREGNSGRVACDFISLRAPSVSPWKGDCFAAHNIKVGDDIGRAPMRETIIARCGPLA